MDGPFVKLEDIKEFPQEEGKGHLISKANCQGFSQKTNENTSHTSKNEFIRSFFGRILGLTIFFEINWPLVALKNFM